MEKWILFTILIAGIILVLFLVPSISDPRTKSAQNACVGHLKYLQKIKIEWAAVNRKASRDTPSEEDLFGPDWRSRMPRCPSGGTYRIGRLQENPTCSFGAPEH